MTMHCCGRINGVTLESFAGTLATGNSAVLVSAANGLSRVAYIVRTARISKDSTATITLTSNGVSICPVANDEGEIEDFLIEGYDLTVTVGGTGNGSYAVTIQAAN